MKQHIYHGVVVNRRLNADEQRSLAMRLRNFGVKYGVKVSEAVTPVETTKPKLTVVYETDDEAPKLTERQKLEQENAALRKRIAMKKGAKKAKASTKPDEFYEEVIVGGRDERIEKRPYRCPVKGCYKFGKTFTANGWNGTDANKGHVDLAHEGDSKVTKAALAYRLK